MLEGFDKDWVNAGRRRYVGYANLPGGDYNFKIKATNKPGDWNVPAVSIPFHVAQPFYKTWWFLVLLSVIVFNSMYIFYRYKLKKQQQIMHLSGKASALEKEKALVMYESLKQHLNPHFLFNSLNTIFFQIDRQNSKARETLLSFSEMLRYQLYECNGHKIPVEKEMAYLKNYVDLQRHRLDDNYWISFAHHNVTDFSVAPLLLIPFVENAFKHVSHLPKDNEIRIDLWKKENTLRMVVFNTCDPEQMTKSNGHGIGLKNVRRRLDLLYGGRYKLDYQKKPGSYQVNLEMTIN